MPCSAYCLGFVFQCVFWNIFFHIYECMSYNYGIGFSYSNWLLGFLIVYINMFYTYNNISDILSNILYLTPFPLECIDLIL